VASFDLSDTMLSSGALASLGGRLYYERCSRCRSLIAVDARRDPSVLDEIYRALPDEYWTRLSPQDRFAHTLERHVRRRHSGGDLWDVGCGTGTLLLNMSDGWSKHGIEPGARAVDEARRQNLDVRQGTAATCGLREVADVVVLVDVIEHMPSPQAELDAIYQMLRPGGTFAVFTGRADARLARLSGSLWYYLHCVGHVTIVSRDALRELLERAGFVDVEVIRVEHQGGVSWWKWLQRVAGNAARVVLRRQPAGMHYLRDHQLALATKPKSKT
jgi:SAM-dependent methyltransferase